VRSVAELPVAIWADYDHDVDMSLDHNAPAAEMSAFVLDKVPFSSEAAEDGITQLKGCYMGQLYGLTGVEEMTATGTAQKRHYSNRAPKLIPPDGRTPAFSEAKG
jgi:hypothetical protein